MGLIYDRIVTILRPNTQLTPGDAGYGGLRTGQEEVIAKDLVASVQTSTSSTRQRAGDFMSAPPAPLQWTVYIRRGQVAVGTIVDRDVVVDDLGRRFQVSGADCHFMGWTLFTIRLEAH